jgi:hypothetical protein
MKADSSANQVLDPFRQSASLADALADGRQSERALEIQRGVCRLMRALGEAPVTEMTLADGRRADVMALSFDGRITIIEIKSSVADFRADTKWQDYHAFCDRFFFAVLPDFPKELVPLEAGLIVADRYGAEILRDADHDRLSGARRKAVTLRFARHAALRLQSAMDPGGGSSE